MEKLNNITKNFRKNANIFFHHLLERVKKADLPSTGAMLAYFLLFSIFPFLIFVLNLISLTVGDYRAVIEVLDYLPANVKSMLLSIIIGIVSSSSGTLMSFSLLLAIWAGSNAIMKLMQEINEAFGVKENRKFIMARVYGILFTIALGVLIVIMMVSNVFGKAIISLINNVLGTTLYIDRLWNYLFKYAPFFFITLVFALLYRISPNLDKKNKIRIRDVLPGATFTSIMWIIVTVAFSYYVDNFGNYDATYGSLGGIVVLMLWFYISSMIMILGAYVSASYIFVKRKRYLDTMSENIERMKK